MPAEAPHSPDTAPVGVPVNHNANDITRAVLEAREKGGSVLLYREGQEPISVFLTTVRGRHPERLLVHRLAVGHDADRWEKWTEVRPTDRIAKVLP